MLRALVALLLVPAAVWAEDWQRMGGAEITTALTGHTVIYENATQHFFGSGRTLYNAGQDSWGYWAVRGDQYCSQWPPSDQWDCYDMAANADQVRFIAPDGSVTDGVMAAQ